MKNNVIKLIIVFSFLILSFCPVSSINADSYESELNNEEYSLVVIDNLTGEKVDVVITEYESNIKQINHSTYTINADLEADKEYEKNIFVRFEIPVTRANESLSGSQTYGDFYAYLKINYVEGGTTSLPTIKVTSVSGYWSCDVAGGCRFEDREVIAHQGRWFFDNFALYEQPTSNSFSYQTGWGFADKLNVTDFSGVMAMSTAKAVINGMGGGYTMQVKITYP